jgi:hypothetical protein
MSRRKLSIAEDYCGLTPPEGTALGSRWSSIRGGGSTVSGKPGQPDAGAVLSGTDHPTTKLWAVRVRLRLVLDTAECAECVIPRKFLETVALDMMRRDLPGVVAVRISDPRESETTP